MALIQQKFFRRKPRKLKHGRNPSRQLTKLAPQFRPFAARQRDMRTVRPQLSLKSAQRRRRSHLPLQSRQCRIRFNLGIHDAGALENAHPAYPDRKWSASYPCQPLLETLVLLLTRIPQKLQRNMP